MGFLDKAKAAANDLAAKADTALAGSGLTGPGGGLNLGGGGDADRLLRDLGVVAYLESTGRPAPAADKDRILRSLHEAEGRGTLGPLTLRTTPPPAPGQAGAAGYGAPGGYAPVPPPPGAAAAPPPAPSAVDPSAAPAPSAPPPGTPPVAPPAPAAAPPRPSWMTPDQG